jgi:hypothetical protein
MFGCSNQIFLALFLYLGGQVNKTKIGENGSKQPKTNAARKTPHLSVVSPEDLTD